MKENDGKFLQALQRDFGAANMESQGIDTMPAPLSKLILRAGHPFYAATCTLMEGSLRYYPLEVEDFLLGDALRVYFKCRAIDRVATTRFTREELTIQDRHITPFAAEPVAAWNIVQLRMAMILMDNAPKSGRAVSHAAIDAMRRAPRSFYNSLTSHISPYIH